MENKSRRYNWVGLIIRKQYERNCHFRMEFTRYSQARKIGNYLSRRKRLPNINNRAIEKVYSFCARRLWMHVRPHIWLVWNFKGFTERMFIIQIGVRTRQPLITTSKFADFWKIMAHVSLWKSIVPVHCQHKYEYCNCHHNSFNLM